MNIDITKLANILPYMIDKKIKYLDDRKILLLLFFIDYEHFKLFDKKIFNDTYIKTKKNPTSLILNELFEIIKNEEILEDYDERVYFIEEILEYLNIDIIKKENFTSLKFNKNEEEYDLEIFEKEELKTINKILNRYLDISVRNLSNETFKIDEIRTITESEIIF